MDGSLVEPKSTEDVLYEVGLDCHPELFDDIVSAFTNDAWVRAAQGHWATPHQSEIWRYSWHGFEEWIKHEVRFFFSHVVHRDSSSDPFEVQPAHMLSIVSKLVRDVGLIVTRTGNEVLYRVRERIGAEGWVADTDSMGAPPAEKAMAGRMNPAGISYLYLACDEQTAVAEVVRAPPATIVVAEFRVTRALRILDLTALPCRPSIFDISRKEQWEGLIFLEHFVAAICEPVAKDGREHVSYAPSQVVSEFFALVFKDGKRNGLDGILYPSTVKPGGKNLVLFPTDRGVERRFDTVEFQSAYEKEVASL